MRRLAWLNVFTHLVGLAFAATVMQDAFLGSGSVRHVGWWRIAWTWWLFAGFTQVWFIARLVQWRRDIPALWCAAAGLAADIVGDLYWIVKVEFNPHIYRLGAVYANGLYTLSVLLVGLRRGVVWPTLAVAAAGFSFTVSALADWTDGIMVSSGATILLYCAWCPIVAKSSSSEATGSSAA